MGSQFSTLLGVAVPDWDEKPDVPKWMLATENATERYSIIPVATAAARETLIPVPSRWVGQTTYRADGDVFEYWTGTAWRAWNTASYAPATIAVASYPDIKLSVGKNYQLTMALNVSVACQLLLDIAASVAYTVTPTNYATVYMAPVHNGDIGTWISRSAVGYPNANGGFYANLFGQLRYMLSPGAHTIGLNLTQGSGSATATVSIAKAVGTRISNVANSAAGTGAYGAW